MAVAFDNNVTIDNFGVTSLTTGAFTIGAGANRVGVLGLCALANTSAESASLAGTAGSAVANTDLFALSIQVKMFATIAPASGSKTATASWTTSASASLGVITFTGADQTTGVNNGVTKQAAFSTTVSQIVTSNAGDMTCTMVAGGNSDGTETSNQTKKISDFACLDIGGGAGNTTHTWAHVAAEDLVFAGLNVIQSGGGGGGTQSLPPSFALMGVQ